ncbi:hypothetical protein Emag_006041 [Eimeria magna]
MAVDWSTLARREGPECGEARDASCQSRGSGAREHQRLLWASEFFPASHWTSGAGSTFGSSRCNSRNNSGRHSDRPGPVTEIHASLVSVPANETPEEASATSTLPRADNDLYTRPFSENRESLEKTASSKMRPSASFSTAANTSSKKNLQSPCKRHQAGSAQASSKASLVWGPLAVQETLSERQLSIEKRMMELRQQNRKRLQRRQQEAKLQQQQRLKEQQAVLLARRHRLKLASLWKERGMAAAARSSSLSKESIPQRQSHAAASVQNGTTNAEELLTALVISESIDLQHVDAGSDSGQCTPALPSNALCTSSEEPSGEASSSFSAQKSRTLQALPTHFLHAPSRPIETDSILVAPPCPDYQATSLKATNSAGSYLHLCLHQPTQCRADSLNSDAASRPSQGALSVHKRFPKLQTASSTSRSCQRQDTSQQKNRAGGSLHSDPDGVLRGAHPQSLKTSKTCSATQHQLRRSRLRPELTQSSIANIYRRDPEVSSSVTALLRVANKLQLEPVRLAQGDLVSRSFKVPGTLASTDNGKAAEQLTRRDQQPQAVVVVSDYQLKRNLELELQHRQAVQHEQAARYGSTTLQAEAAYQEVPTQAKDLMSSSGSQMKYALLADKVASKANGEPREVPTANSLEGSAFVPAQQVARCHSSEQQLRTLMVGARDACLDRCTETLKKQAVCEERFRLHSPEGIVSGKDNHLFSSTESEAQQQEATSSDGAARAQATGLQLVRVTGRICGSLGAQSTDQASLMLGRCPLDNANRPLNGQSFSSRLQWQAAREHQVNGIPERAENSLTHFQQPFKCISSAEQQQGGQERCCMQSHRANEGAGSSRDSPKHQEEKAVSNTSSALTCISLERTRQWNPTFLAVQALEQAQQLEENRLLLLEVSHHAVEREARNRRKEVALIQWLQQQHNQQRTQEAGDSSSHKYQQPQHQQKIDLAPREPTAEGGAQQAVALSGKAELAESYTLRTSHCHQQAHLYQKSKWKQVKQSFRRSRRTPHLLSPGSFPAKVAQRAANFAYSQHSDALQASHSKKQSRVEESTRLLGDHGVDKANSTLMQPPNYEELLQRQRALLQQLLQQCLWDIPANQRPLKGSEPPAFDNGARGPLWTLKALAHMRR